MSQNIPAMVNLPDLHDASRERLLAEIGLLQLQHSLTDSGQLQTQIVQLETEHEQQATQHKFELANSEMKLLHARDYARGCAAELGEARAHFQIHIADADQKVRQARKKVQNIYATRTWKMGRLVMLPVRIMRRLLRLH